MDKSADYTTSFVVEQSPEAVFAAVSNPRAWWSEDTQGDARTAGSVFYYHYKDMHRGTFTVTEAVPGKKLVWHVVQNYFNFVQDSTEWTGTDIVFEIAPVAGGTELRFTHVGLKPSEECYDVCQDSWNFYITASLQNLIANGVGQPNKGEQNDNPTVVPVLAPPAPKTPEVVVMTKAAAKPGMEEKVRDALRDVSAAGRRHAGCLEYSVFRSATEPHVTLCHERWVSKADRDAFLQSADVKAFVDAITGAFLTTPSPAAYDILAAA